MNLPRITFSAESDAAYVYLQAPRAGIVNVTMETRDPDVLLDYDAAGRLVGIEILSARANLAQEVLDIAEEPSLDEIRPEAP